MSIDSDNRRKRIMYWKKVVRALEELNMGYNSPAVDETIEIIRREIVRIKKGDDS